MSLYNSAKWNSIEDFKKAVFALVVDGVYTLQAKKVTAPL